MFIAPLQADAGGPEIVRHELVGRGFSHVPMHQRINPAALAARRDAHQPARGKVGEVGREIRDHEEVVRLSDAPGLLVVFGDCFKLIAQIQLRDFLDVLVQLREALFDVFGLRPDALIDEAILVIRQVHQAGETLPEIKRVENREHHAAGR